MEINDPVIENKCKDELKKVIEDNKDKNELVFKERIKGFKELITDDNFNQLKEVIQNGKIKEFEDYYHTEEKEQMVKSVSDNSQLKILVESNNRIERQNVSIKQGAKYTLLVNGTTDITDRYKDVLQWEFARIYFLTNNFEPNSVKSAGKYASMLNGGKNVFIKWKGDNILNSFDNKKETMKSKANYIINYYINNIK